jgi:hypothetical protein
MEKLVDEKITFLNTLCKEGIRSAATSDNTKNPRLDLLAGIYCLT